MVLADEGEDMPTPALGAIASEAGLALAKAWHLEIGWGRLNFAEDGLVE